LTIGLTEQTQSLTTGLTEQTQSLTTGLTEQTQSLKLRSLAADCPYSLPFYHWVR